MPTSLNWLLSLRTWVLGTWMLLWTGFFLLSIFLNEAGTKLTAGPGRWAAVAALTGTALLALGSTMSERLREVVIEPTRRDLYDPKPLVYLGLLTAMLAIQLAFARAPST
jgi:hypothetical protein